MRRDLPRLADAALTVPVQLAMSVAVFDDELQDAVEPGTPTATARLATVTAADRGRLRRCGVHDARAAVPHRFRTSSSTPRSPASRPPAPRRVTYSALHLRPGVKEWFAQWLHRLPPGVGAQVPRAVSRRLVRPKVLSSRARGPHQAAHRGARPHAHGGHGRHRFAGRGAGWTAPTRATPMASGALGRPRRRAVELAPASPTLF